MSCALCFSTGGLSDLYGVYSVWLGGVRFSGCRGLLIWLFYRHFLIALSIIILMLLLLLITIINDVLLFGV